MESVDKIPGEVSTSGVGCGGGFAKCTEHKYNAKFGQHEIRCRLGLWSVSAADKVEALREAAHYWRQYYSDGEYDAFLANNADEGRAKS